MPRNFGEDKILEDAKTIPTLDARMGTGGNNVPIVLESNQNHATITNNGICPTLPASMGMGGGYVPMVVIESDEERETEESN